MKKYYFLFLCACLFTITMSAPACAVKSGCPANESLKVPVNKKGEIKGYHRSKSGLFPKKMTKKMKK